MKNFIIKEWQDKNLTEKTLDDSIKEAAPKMKVDPDAEYVSDVISRLGVIGRNATGPNVKKAITKALKVLQNLRSSIQVGR
mgnify:FL=1|tara:strand:+ start:2510 stop:2752 length:243 start_codon:yes stop_codon:yes gene_type:complete